VAGLARSFAQHTTARPAPAAVYTGPALYIPAVRK